MTLTSDCRRTVVFYYGLCRMGDGSTSRRHPVLLPATVVKYNGPAAGDPTSVHWHVPCVARAVNDSSHKQT